MFDGLYNGCFVCSPGTGIAALLSDPPSGFTYSLTLVLRAWRLSSGGGAGTNTALAGAAFLHPRNRLAVSAFNHQEKRPQAGCGSIGFRNTKGEHNEIEVPGWRSGAGPDCRDSVGVKL